VSLRSASLVEFRIRIVASLTRSDLTKGKSSLGKVIFTKFINFTILLGYGELNNLSCIYFTNRGYIVV